MEPLTRQIMKSLKESKHPQFHDTLEELQPYDISMLYKDLPRKHHLKFLLMLSPQQIAELLQELETEHQQRILEMLGVQKTGSIMNLMASDDLAALLQELSPERIAEHLDNMKQKESTIVQNIMNYPEETAGRLMSSRFIWVKKNYTIRDVVEKIKKFAALSEMINYIYVVDENKVLLGVVSHRDIILADENAFVEDIMYTRLVSVPVDMDQEKAASLVARYDFVSLPVIEDDGTLVGIITVDDMIDVVIQEATEDIEKLSAGGKSIDFDTKALTAAIRRLPWLIGLLFIGLISATIIAQFEKTLEQVVALAYFMPLIAGMTGNTGTQSLAVVVRGVITREMTKKVAFKLIFREMQTGLMIGLTCGALFSTIVYVWSGDFATSLIIGTPLILTLIIGTLAGTTIPLLLFKFKVDPAVASGPLITTLNDILSLMIYFGIATAFLSYLL